MSTNNNTSMKLINSLILIVFFISGLPLSGQTTDCESARKDYLNKNPDVAKAGMDPWDHYNRFGINEGRKWPKCKTDNPTSAIEENNNTDVSEIKGNVKIAQLNTDGSFLSQGKAPFNVVEKCAYLKQKFSTYDSLRSIVNKFKGYTLFENKNINVNEVTSQSVGYYKNKKILFFRAGEWDKHIDKLINMGFDPLRLHSSYKLCKLYFAYDSKENKYMELPYYELNELFVQKLNLNQYNRQYYNCNYLKGSFNKFLKKNPNIFEEIDESEVSNVLFKLTNIDDYKTYRNLSVEINRVNQSVYDYEQKYKINLNDHYYYWGEKKNEKASGNGFIVRKTNNNILLTCSWEDGSLTSAFVYYFYKENKGYYIKGNDNVFHIVETPNNTNSYFYFGNYLSNYQNYDWVRHGVGEYYWSNGHYAGHWKFGERTGFGTYTANPGLETQTRFQGEFLNGNLNGYGKKFDNNGSVILEGLWSNGNFSKTKEQLESEHREEADKQRKAAEMAASLTSGNFDKQLEKGFNEMMGDAILKKALGQNVDTKEMLQKQVSKLENEVLKHPMSSEEKKYFAAFYEKKTGALSMGLDMLNAMGGNAPSNSTRYAQPNAYQCSECLMLSNGNEKPLGDAYGGCNTRTSKGKSHYWHPVNTNCEDIGKRGHYEKGVCGLQCSSCGEKCYILTPSVFVDCYKRPVGSGADGYLSHQWRTFSK